MAIKYKMEICPECDGNGVLFYTEKKLWGLIKNQVAYQCTVCEGTGKVRGEPLCPICGGAGLIGNEREICRTCNGTGTGDGFRHLTREQLVKGTTFNRRCDRCKAETLHELTSDIEHKVITTTWEKNEWQRSKEEFERIKIECTMCGNSYFAPLDKYYHVEGGLSLNENDEVVANKKSLFGQDFTSPGELFK
ncbi:hypothetical protein J7K50_01895 [bacterium]|nr:hypothetical protein [bacterium]